MQYDLIIIGGGLVGAGLACALRHSTLKIALIDAREEHAPDPRLFGLNYSSCEFLKNLGIWPNLTKHAAPIREVQISNQGRFGAVRLHCDDINLAALGYVIPAYVIETALNETLLNASNIHFYRPAKLKTLLQENDLVTITIEDTETKTLTSPLVMGADGTNSTVRSQLNIPTEFFDYEQSAIVTRTELHRSHQNIAYERFIKNGAIAMLPLNDCECATIWTIDNNKKNELMALSDQAFLKALQDAFGYRLGRFNKIHNRFVYPLQMIRAEKNIAGRVFLLGNSAHTLHPVAAQGLNLALYEVAALVEGILEKITANDSFGIDDLAQISSQIKRHQATSISLSHRLPQLFSNQSILIGTLLSFGMIGFNMLTPVKKRFIERIMGRVGRVPRLLLHELHL